MQATYSPEDNKLRLYSLQRLDTDTYNRVKAAVFIWAPVAICANGPRQREQLQPLAEHWEDLPAGTFKEAGTNVNSALLVIRG